MNIIWLASFEKKLDSMQRIKAKDARCSMGDMVEAWNRGRFDLMSESRVSAKTLVEFATGRRKILYCQARNSHIAVQSGKPDRQFTCRSDEQFEVSK